MRTRNKKRRIESKAFSTPIWIYVVAGVCSVVCFCLSKLLLLCECDNQCDEWWSNFFLNIGYGMIASIAVTILVDVGNTIRDNQKEKRIFERLTSELKLACANLPSEMYTAVYDCYGYDLEGKFTFDEWTEKLFISDGSYNEKQKWQIEYVVQEISKIKQQAMRLESDIKNFYDNSFVEESFQKQLKRVVFTCDKIEHFAKRSEYRECYKLIVRELKNNVFDLFDEIKNDYEIAYNEEEYID